jgi:hypothetical protein
MSLLSKLFRIKAPRIHKPNGEPKTSGELIAEVTEGANLVEGKQTWEYAEKKKHNIEYMKKWVVVQFIDNVFLARIVAVLA